MWSITLKLMKNSTKMLIPAGIAILIGTAFIACTFLFGNTLNASLRSQFTAKLGQANYVVQPGKQADQGATLSDFHLDRLQQVRGVNGVRADVSASVELSKDGRHFSSMAILTARDRAVLPVDLVQGTQPLSEGQIAIPQALAKQLKVGVGDDIAVDVNTDDAQAPPTQLLRVVGISEDTHGAYSYYSGASIIPEGSMAALYGLDGRPASLPAGTLYLDIDPAHAQETVQAITPLLPASFTVTTREAVSSAAIEATNTGGMNPVTIFLLVFGVIAMFVAAMVIANTFQVMVMQRRRIFALLRTIGAKKSQIYHSVVLEAMLFGLVSSLVGILFGIAIMAIVCGSGVLGQTAPDAKLVISVPVIVVPLVFGVVMTVLASLGSARAATMVSPLEALRPTELLETNRTGRLRMAFGMLCTFLGMAGAGWSVYRMHGYLQTLDEQSSAGYSTILGAAIASCVLVFLGLALTAVLWLPRLMNAMGALAAWTGPSATIAHANIQKNPRRVGATGLALLIGVTLVSTIATGAASGKQTIDNELDTRYSVDLAVSGSGLNDQSEARLKAVSGVSDTLYAPFTVGQVKDAKGKTTETMLVGVPDGAALQSVMRANLHNISIDDATVLLPESLGSQGAAWRFDHNKARFEHIGADQTTASDDAAKTSTSGPAVELAVQQRDFQQIGVPYQAVGFVSLSHFEHSELPGDHHILLAKIDAGSSGLSTVLDNAQSALGGESHVQLTGPIAQRMQWDGIINVMMGLLIGLLAVAVLIALIGVANTLILSVIERTRESATLRAIGMTRGQLKRSLACEAVLIAMVSGIVGVVLGTVFGWLGSYIVFSLFGKVVLSFDWAMNGAVLLVAAVAALLASVFPARKALRAAPVEALAEA